MSAQTTDDSSTKADEMHVSPAIAKPNVICRFGQSSFSNAQVPPMLAEVIYWQ